MKKILLFTFITIYIFSCGSVKQTEEALNSGNYDHAINIALKNLKTNKDKKGKQAYIKMLEAAFAKSVDRDINHINFLKKDGNKAHLEEIYNTYNQLNNRQNKIKPILPLYIIEENRNARFSFTDYSESWQTLFFKRSIQKFT